MEKAPTEYDNTRDATPDESVDAAEKGVEIEPAQLPSSHNADALHKTVTAQDWNGPDDPGNPVNWPLWQRVYHTTIPGLFGFAVTFGSSVYTPGYPEVMEKFHVSGTVALLGLSLYVLGLAFGPVLAAPISETQGRRVVYLVSLTSSCSFHVGSGIL